MQPRRIIALVCLGVVMLAGCALVRPPEQWKNVAVPNINVGSTEPPQELSPKQTAIACITTAEALEARGHDREAVRLYEKARAADDKRIDYSRRLAVLLDHLGESARAEQEFQTALRQNPDDWDLLNDYGYFQMRAGRLAEAEQTFRRVITEVPSHEHATVNLGMTLGKQQRWPECFEIFSKVVGPAAAHSNVGVLMAKAGQYQQAKHAFEQALAIDQNLPQPRAFLAKLSGLP